MTPSARLMLALDAPDLAESLRVARRVRGLVKTVKVGSILFTAAGPDAIARMRRLGFDVFLDLKFHDIPSTVEKSCRAAMRHGVSWLTVHAGGGVEMVKAAVFGVTEEARRRRCPQARVLGVTVLTSVPAPTGGMRGRSGAATAPGALARQVVGLAAAARKAGADGVVASAWEAAAIRRRLGRSAVIVCPGIRPAGADAVDQRRVATPGDALRRGADYLVIGRPVTDARDPRAVIVGIIRDMEGVK